MASASRVTAILVGRSNTLLCAIGVPKLKRVNGSRLTSLPVRATYMLLVDGAQFECATLRKNYMF